MIFGDSREMRAKALVNGELVEVFRPEHGGVDQIIFLKQGQSWSYDFLVQTTFKPGEQPKEYRFERKALGDFAASMFNGDKLARQTSYVDGLIIEITPEEIEALRARYDDADVSSFLKRLARMTCPTGEYGKLWILFSFGPVDTLRLLRYVESGRATRG